MGKDDTQALISKNKTKESGETSKTVAFIVIGGLTAIYVVAELGVAIYTDSLTLLSDGFHNLSDVVSLYIAWWAAKAAKRDSDNFMSYGWARTELLGGLTNGIFLLSMCLYVALESIPRFIEPTEIDTSYHGYIFMAIAGAGLFINVLGTIVFALTGMAHAHSHGGGGGHSHGGGGGHSHGNSKKNDDHGHSHGDKKKKEKKHGHSHDNGAEEEEHGHSHGGDKAKHGHSHGGEKKKENTLINLNDEEEDHHDHEEEHGHSHDGEKKEKKHGHSHDGEKKEKKHGHSHDGEKKEKKHGHSHGAEETPKKKHGHSHGDNEEKDDHGHSHGGKDKKKKAGRKGTCGMDYNMFGVFIHFLGDAISSLFVLITGIVIQYTHGSWTKYIDPAVSLVIVIMIAVSSFPLVKRCSMILLQKVPDEIDLDSIRYKMSKVKGVISQHDLHVWQLVDGMTIASVHVGIRQGENFENIVTKLKKIFHKEGIHSTSIQPEFIDESISKDSNFCVQNCIEECEEEWCCKKTADRIKLRTISYSTNIDIGDIEHDI